MNDEINKILDNIKNKYDSYLVCDIVSGDDLKLLLDYINKLQSNWNSLREWLEVNDRYSQGYFKQVLEYMNELEGKDKE